MTFPFSCHNYHLRFWMAAGGIDPDEDVRLVVLPPPYMVDSLASRHVDGFCVGAPWNSVAVELGVGHILHFGYRNFRARRRKRSWRCAQPGRRGSATMCSSAWSARCIERPTSSTNPDNLAEVVALLAAPHRIGVAPELIERTLKGRLRIAPDGNFRSDADYLLIGRKDVARPEPADAAWLYAQMVRWDQAPMSADLLAAAKACFRPDLYDSALGRTTKSSAVPAEHIGAFTGPRFDADDVAAYLAAAKCAGYESVKIYFALHKFSSDCGSNKQLRLTAYKNAHNLIH